jgi:hypothetical protein
MSKVSKLKFGGLMRDVCKHLKGGELSSDEVQKFVDAGYKKKGDVKNIDDFELDPELSSRRDKVYINKKTGKAVHTIAGTDNTKDWINNLAIPLGLHHKTNRYKNAEDIQKKAIQKYGKENVGLVSHSQSGNIAENLTKRGLTGKDNITLNPAIIGSHDPNIHVIRSDKDVVSALTRKNKNDTTIKSEGKWYDPRTYLKEHGTNILSRTKKIFGGVLTAEQKKLNRIEANKKHYLKKKGKSDEASDEASEDDLGAIDKNKVILLENMLKELKYIKKDELKEIVKNISEANPSLNIKFNKAKKDMLIDIVIKYKIHNDDK